MKVIVQRRSGASVYSVPEGPKCFSQQPESESDMLLEKFFTDMFSEPESTDDLPSPKTDVETNRQKKNGVLFDEGRGKRQSRG